MFDHLNYFCLRLREGLHSIVWPLTEFEKPITEVALPVTYKNVRVNQTVLPEKQ